MKKLIAMMFAGLLLVAPVLAEAQNIPTSYNASGIGVPNYTLQSGGSNYGLLQNSAASSSWSLAFGTSQSVNGTAALTWDSTPAVTANVPFALGKSQVGTATGAFGVYASSTIPVGSSYILLLSSGSNLLVTSTPSLSTATSIGGATSIADGTLVVVTSTDAATITLQDDGTLSGSKLELGASTRAISAKKTLTLIYQATLGKWLEIAYGNN